MFSPIPKMSAILAQAAAQNLRKNLVFQVRVFSVFRGSKICVYLCQSVASSALRVI
jgi:hypothetical protein